MKLYRPTGFFLVFLVFIVYNGLSQWTDDPQDSRKLESLLQEVRQQSEAGLLPEDSLAQFHFAVATQFFQQADFVNTYKWLNACMELGGDNKELMAKCYMLGGEVSLEEDERVLSLKQFMQALDIFNELHDSLNYLVCLRKIGNNYDYMNEHQIALEYYNKCVELARKLGNDQLLIATWNNMAGIYNDDGDGERAVEVFNEAVQLALQIGDHEQQTKLYGNLSLTYRGLGKYDSSRLYAVRAIQLAKKYKERKSEGFGYQALGYLYFELGRLDSSEFYMNKTLEISLKIRNAQLETNASKQLEEIYYKTGRFKEAYELLSLVKEQEDSLYNQQTLQLIQSMKIQYENEKHELEMAENRLRLQQADESLIREKNRQIVLIVVVFLLLIILFLILRGYVLRKRNNEQLLTKNTEIERHAQQVERLNETRSRWFINVAHELRTPLTLIKGPVQRLLSSGTLMPEMLSDLILIERNAHTITNQVNEMLELARMEEGQMTLRCTTFDICELVRYTVSNFDSRAERLGIALNCQATGSFYLRADRDKLYKLLINLVSNALKFTPKGGRVSVQLSTLPPLRISVEDNGRGISEEDLPHVFERFYQSANPENLLEGGTGIGLALSKEIAEMHQGSLSVSSRQGAGSVFTLELPESLVAEAPTLVEEPETEWKKSPERKGESVRSFVSMESKPLLLLAEDHDDMRKYVASLLEAYFQVVQVQSGREALEVLRTRDVKFIISDVMMPEMDGVTFLKHVKSGQLWKHIPFMHLSAITDDDIRKDTLRIGIDDYMVKPFDPEELIIRVQNLYDNYLKRIAVDSAENLTSYDSKVMQRLKEEVLKNMDDHTFNVLRLADAAAMSERQLYRYLKVASGLTPLQFIQEIKLNKANELARKMVYTSVAELANAVGFRQASYFSALFEKRFGKKPSSIIKGMR